MRKAVFILFILIPVPMTVYAADFCTKGQYRDEAGVCTPCKVHAAYYCPGDDTRHECPPNDVDWAGLTGAPVTGTPMVYAWGDGSTTAPTRIESCLVAVSLLFPQGTQYRECRYRPGQTYAYYCDNIYWRPNSLADGYYACGEINESNSAAREVCECTELPKNAHWTGHGTPGIDDCPWKCNDGYYKSGEHECSICGIEEGYYVNDADECVTTCRRGHYVPTPFAACIPVAYGDHFYVEAEHTVKYGDTSDANIKLCPARADGVRGTVSGAGSYDTNAGSINICFAGNSNVRYTAEDRGDCVVNPDKPLSCKYETHGRIYAVCFYTTGPDGAAIYDQQTVDPATGESRRACVPNARIVSCDAGWYDPYNGATTGSINPQQLPCQPVDVGYWSPDGDLARYPCPAGTATCGYGECASSESDCKPVRYLRAATGLSLVLWSKPQLSPTLVVRTPDNMKWYATSIPGARSGNLNISYHDETYAFISPLDLFVEYTTGNRTFKVIEIPEL